MHLLVALASNSIAIFLNLDGKNVLNLWVLETCRDGMLS